ncbi:chemotaxis protein CheW [Desulforamulus aquiferis]|uniref:Chemotaxis protein CheW n=1 Tax=Desulforamulus aquiferis TaxID=1397668 RepID=A0AAW7Z988_9FIRM|nr:chemotaxis protein CheW [Desulforamulus aquiferis]MDO7785902.1 chemotaxis protein CheW [Desulforamulus aquiferis]
MSKTKAVIFEIGATRYGIDIMSSKEIIKLQTITPIAGTSTVIEGVISLRDKVIPVVRLGRFLGISEQDYTEDTRIIIIEINNRKFGLIVDNVCEVEDILDEEMQKVDLMVGNNHYIKGIVKKDEQLWLILDIEKFIF